MKIKLKNEKKIKNLKIKKYIYYFFIKNQKQKNEVPKNKMKNAYWSFTANMAASTQFLTKYFVTPHK